MGNNIALTIEEDTLFKAKFDRYPFAFGASLSAYKGKLVAPVFIAVDKWSLRSLRESALYTRMTGIPILGHQNVLKN